MIHDRVSLAGVKPLTREEYFVRGSTALIDAVGSAMEHIEKIHKYARPADLPEHTLFVITTDGMENSSYRYSAGEVRKKIEEKKEKCGWEFLFIGANIDAVETAKHFGIGADRAVDYHADTQGTSVLYKAVSDAVCKVRAHQKGL